MLILSQPLIEAHDMICTLFTCSGEMKFSELSKAEMESIDYVIEKLRSLSVSEIIIASHQQSGWLNNSETHPRIPYDEAFSLKLI